MSNSLRVLSYEDGSQITLRGRCHKPFKELRCLRIPDDISELPMEFEKLEHLAYYRGPFTQAMSLYELPPSLRAMNIKVSAPNGVKDFKVPPSVTSASSLVKLDLNNMQRLPDGIEKLTKLERLGIWGSDQLRELPSKFGELRNLRELTLFDCLELKELPSDFGRLSNLKYMLFNRCSTFNELSYGFGQLNNLKMLALYGCSALSVLPSELGLLKNLECLDLSFCSGLKELPCDLGQLQNLQELRLRDCSGLQELPFEGLLWVERVAIKSGRSC